MAKAYLYQQPVFLPIISEMLITKYVTDQALWIYKVQLDAGVTTDLR